MSSRRPIGSARKMRASINSGCAANDRLEIHLRENVAFDVDAGRDLLELEAVGGQSEHAALGDVQHLLLARGGERRR